MVERSCAPDPPLQFICGAERPEDLAQIPGGRWLIASGFSRGAGIKLIDLQARVARFWFVGGEDQLNYDAALYPDCPLPPDPTLLSAQGINLRTLGAQHGALHVVNHGGRESIEVFSIGWSAYAPQISWRGCIPLPNGLAANSVATFSDGAVLFTVLTRPGTTITDFVRGENTGGVYEWRPDRAGVRLLEGTELPGNNGLETAPDDSAFYVIAFGRREVVMFRREDTRRPLRSAAAPGFMPDNIHWDEGRLITAGMVYDEPACGGVRRIVDGVADMMACPRGYVTAQVDPETLQFRLLAYGQPSPRFNGVSAAVLIGDELWLGSYQSDRLAVRRLPYLSPKSQ